MGRITRFAYDRLSRLVAVVLPNPATGANPPLVDGNSPEAGALVTRYAYDEQGNKISQTDAEGRITRWTFDGMGRQRSRVLPMGQQESFEYDAGGQPSAHLTFNGERIETTHDSLGRIATLTLPGGHVRRFTYSASGQVAQIDDNGAVYGFEYDAHDRLTRAVDPQGRAIDYRYDAVGNRTELATARQQIRYAFDELHRLREVVAQLDGGTPQTTTYGYDAVGNRSGMSHPNGTTVEYGYDLRNRLSSLVHRARQAAGAAVLLGLSYTVDASGLRTEIAETRPGTSTAITRTSAYTYDWVKRLTREQVTGSNSQARTSSWTYDKVGNRKTESTSGTFYKNLTYTVDANDRLTRESGSPATFDYVYDNAGNLLQKKQGSTVLASYSWSAEGRMLGATLGTGVNQIVTSYQYDPSGIRRSQEAVAGGVRSRTDYLVDPNQAYAQVLEDWEASAASSSELPAATLGNVYLHGDDLISQTLLANNLATSTQVYHYDGLGSTRALSQFAVDASGNPLANHGQVSDRYAYTAFGEADPAGSSGNNTNATENAYRYTGEQLDPNLGFYYLRARYMDPRAGRFLGMDAFAGVDSDPVTLHKYLYASADPVNGTDPSGYFTLTQMMSTINTVSTLANYAISTYSFVKGNPDSDVIDGVPTIWDLVMTYAVKAAASQLMAVPQANSSSSRAPGRTEDHHVIPVYCCGAVKQNPLVRLPIREHQRIHRALNRYTVLINVAGKGVDLLVYKRPSSIFKKTPLQRLGRTRAGRAAIWAGLYAFYTDDGSLGAGTPTIEAALLIQGPLFQGKQHSATRCRR